MRDARTAVLAAVVVVVPLSGCGDGDDSPDAAQTPKALVSCIEDAELEAETTPGDRAVGITGAVRVDLPPRNRVIADFFEDPNRAREYSNGQDAFLSATGGGSEVVADTVVVGYLRPGAKDETKTVVGCVGD